ncbi:MAG: 3-phosphoshikimate 1-carboxyvinyltransferase [Alphaproteobacteria bacterium]|nr:3-phosphoshikimate 1-carboxyvinyltransferase [Alphaproteobacteria bacterium]
MYWTSYPVPALRGIVAAPPDKSCSHRAVILAGLATGTSEIHRLLEGEDVLRTVDAMRALGAGIEPSGPGHWKITGVGPRGLSSPERALDFGNSGTGSRLVMGALAGFPVTARLVGDESLTARPMNRILSPLRRMGLTDTAREDGRLPFTITGRARLRAISYEPPVASAQVKSAVLLAGLNAEGVTEVCEARATRDHTERMLRGFGVGVNTSSFGDTGRRIGLAGGQSPGALGTSIPGDPSSAAFLAGAALISPDGEVLVENVMSNSTRDGIFDALTLMGAALGAEEAFEASGERQINLLVSTSSGLRGREIPERLVPAMIDEFPILAVVAAFADGVTEVRGAGELRVKETDRIGAIVDMLRANGVSAEERPNGFVIEGCAGPPPGGGRVETRHDHRIAMSALVMGTASQNPVSVDDISMIATSYPDFMDHMSRLGADIRPA